MSSIKLDDQAEKKHLTLVIGHLSFVIYSFRILCVSAVIAINALFPR